MHEMSFAESILDGVQRELAGYPGCRVLRVSMRASELLALEPASLRFCLEAVTAGTALEGARFDLREVTVQEDPSLGIGALVIEEIELDGPEDTDRAEGPGERA